MADLLRPEFLVKAFFSFVDQDITAEYAGQAVLLFRGSVSICPGLFLQVLIKAFKGLSIQLDHLLLYIIVWVYVWALRVIRQLLNLADVPLFLLCKADASCELEFGFHLFFFYILKVFDFADYFM